MSAPFTTGRKFLDTPGLGTPGLGTPGLMLSDLTVCLFDRFNTNISFNAFKTQPEKHSQNKHIDDL
jgi:hypothetical protein